MAAHRAGLELVESVGSNPFVGKVDAIIESVETAADIIYLSNPNRLTGVNYPLSDLEIMARAVHRGALLVDEYYYDYFGITAKPLLDVLDNVMVMRSFTAAFGINSSDAGYFAGRPERIQPIREALAAFPVTRTVARTIQAAQINDDALANRLRGIHEESLRIAKALTGMGAQCRITAADFLLIRVADPRRIKADLEKQKLKVDPLDKYEGLADFVRYRILSPLSNDRLIEAFEKIDPTAYRIKSNDLRAATLNRAVENAEQGRDEQTGATGRRNSKPKILEEVNEFNKVSI